jgi:hypothetical protein
MSSFDVELTVERAAGKKPVALAPSLNSPGFFEGDKPPQTLLDPFANAS